ncbi:MAG: hypothetical protein ACE5R6_18445, partial [Candidatus Heimdallarchaeota archaeon]
MYDILIKNGLIIDGSANPEFKADIGLKDGRIWRIGGLTGAKATQ